MHRNFGTGAEAAGQAETGQWDSILPRSAGILLAGSLLVAVCAHVAVPLRFTPVPVTLQPFAVLLLGLLLGPRMAAGTMAAYLAEGAAGMPAFTPDGLGGVSQLLGPTGGYLLSYVLVAPLVSFLWRDGWGRRGRRGFSRALLAAATGSLATLFLGAAWLEIQTHAAPMTLLHQAVLPFLPGDALKVCAAAGIAVGATRIPRYRG